MDAATGAAARAGVTGLPAKSAPRPRPNADFDIRAECRRLGPKSIQSEPPAQPSFTKRAAPKTKPKVAGKLKEPLTAEWKFEDVVKSAQDASVLVLVY